jgi:hypothetical protein
MAAPTSANAVMLRIAARRKWRRLLRALVWMRTSMRHYGSEPAFGL